MGALLHFAVADLDLGIEEEEQAIFTLFPNPADDFLKLNFKEDQTSLFYTITDLSGKTIQEDLISGLNNTFEIDTRTLVAGAYILKLHTNKGLATRRFIKE